MKERAIYTLIFEAVPVLPVPRVPTITVNLLEIL
jgi:hypothetical protein